MAEGRKYDPIINENMETEGVNKGRFKNTDILSEIAEDANNGMDYSSLDYAAKFELTHQAVKDGGATGESLAARAIQSHGGDFPGVTEEEQRTIVHGQVDAAFDRAQDITGQYDALQTDAKDIRDIHRGQMEADKDKEPK